MEQATQVLAAVTFLVIGLSHLVRPTAWVSFYQTLAARGTPGAFLEGFLCLGFGSIIVAFHNVWHGPGVLLTLVGWAQVLKGLVRFLAPHLALRVMARASPDRSWHFRAGGLFAMAVSGFLWWLRLRA